MTRPTIAELFRQLGYDFHGTELDDAILWLLAEVSLLRAQEPVHSDSASVSELLRGYAWLPK
jgi:hypothetical protein